MIVVVNKSEAGIKVIHFFFLQISDNFTKNIILPIKINIKNKSHKLSKFINTTAVINVVKHICFNLLGWSFMTTERKNKGFTKCTDVQTRKH